MKNKAAVVVGLVLFAGAHGAWAQASDRWLAAEDAAIAALPAPRAADRITAATLSCAVQRWTLRLDLASGTDVVDGVGVLDVDGKPFAISLEVADGGLETEIPRDALDPLRAGVRMTLDLAGALELALGDPVFPLRGSRVAIDAVAGKCSLRDMTGYAPVTFTPFSSYLELARELRKADIDAFSLSTFANPTLDVAMSEFGSGRRVLFTRICGSSWYFGSSGCNITGYAPDAGETGWRPVYDTENVHLYTDPRSATEGWPDIATLPVGSEGFPRLWRWDGEVYGFIGELPEQPATGETPNDQPLALRPGSD